MISIEKISSFDGLLNLEKEWNSLLLKSETNTIFLTHEWVKTWWKCFGSDKELFILLVKDDENIIGIAPLMLAFSKHFAISIKKIQFIGTPLSDYCDFIVGERKEDVLGAIYDYIFQNRKIWNKVVLEEIPQNSSTLQLSNHILKKLTKNFDVFFTNECLALDFKAAEPDFVKGLIRKRDIVRHTKDLNNNGGFVCYKSKNIVEAGNLLKIFFEQHIKQWGKKKIPSMFGKKGNSDFFVQLSNELLPKNKFDFWALEFNKKPVAMEIGFNHNNKYVSYCRTYDQEYAKHSPGTILQGYFIEEYHNSKFDEVDFSRGSESYKYRFSNKIINNMGMSIHKNIISHYFAKKYHKIKEKIMKNNKMHSTINKYRYKIVHLFCL